MSDSMGTAGCADPRGGRASAVHNSSRCCRRGLAYRGPGIPCSVAKRRDFRGADESEILGQKKYIFHLPE